VSEFAREKRGFFAATRYAGKDGLGALGWYLHTGDKEEAMKFFPAPGEELPEKPVQEIIALDKLAARFPRSFAKVQRMARVVIEEQFVSFIC
jgi:hypothetical protein